MSASIELSSSAVDNIHCADVVLRAWIDATGVEYCAYRRTTGENYEVGVTQSRSFASSQHVIEHLQCRLQDQLEDAVEQFRRRINNRTSVTESQPKRSSGRCKCELCGRLRESGLYCEPADIGTGPSVHRQAGGDGIAWGAWCSEYVSGERKLWVYSWDTMTEILGNWSRVKRLWNCDKREMEILVEK